MSAHHATLSPSAFPKLNLCVQYEANPVAGPAAERGTRLHEQLSEFHLKGTPISDAGAREAHDRMSTYVPDIRGIEQKLTLTVDFKEVTFGTADVWGYDGDTLIICDYKSGRLEEPHSYREQMAAYALMLMEQEGKESCVTVIVGIDREDADHVEGFTLDEAKQVVIGIIERVEAQQEPPRENKYCQWCVKRSTTCSLWVDPAKAALTVMPSMPATLTKDWILASPENAGRFLAAYKKLQAIVEKDMDVAGFVKESILAGTPVQGWKVQSRKGSERLDTKAVKKRWAELTDEPIPATIGEETFSLVEAK